MRQGTLIDEKCGRVYDHCAKCDSVESAKEDAPTFGPVGNSYAVQHSTVLWINDAIRLDAGLDDVNRQD
jgi:hypothetical protein